MYVNSRNHCSPLFRDIFQSPKVRNRFKGLDLIDGVPDELWTEVHNTVQELSKLYRMLSKPSMRKRNAKRKNGCLRRAYK